MHQVELYVDGSCLGNPGLAGVGIVLKSGNLRREHSMHIGEATNNIAEIKAVIEGLQLLNSPERTEVIIYTDSQLVEGFIMKNWNPKHNQILIEYMKVLLEKCQSFSVFPFTLPVFMS